MKEYDYPIDFVITWVDGSDPIWRKEKEKYQIAELGDAKESRYRDWGTLRYWFRGVEKFAPWVNKIFFVTCGHLPEWLNKDNPKLRIVKHSDYIPKEYLPTFSSRPIDMNFHRIEDLSEHFVYFNDDMFLMQPTQPSVFFKKGLPCDSAIIDIPRISTKDRDGKTRTGDSIYLADVIGAAVVNNYFNKKRSIRKNFFKWYNFKYGTWMFKTLMLAPWKQFPSFRLTHVPYSYLKSTYCEVWEKEPDLLSSVSSHRFRKNNDVNHWIFTYWQFAKGTFSPRKYAAAKYCYIKNEGNDLLYQDIKKQSYKMMCLNDEFTADNFEEESQKLINAFECILPDKSSFEV